jgi:hypothetical protein
MALLKMIRTRLLRPAGDAQSVDAMPKVIGLVRHYPVKQPSRSGRCDAEQFASWCDRYNSAAVRLPDVPPLSAEDWDVCLSSDMKRAAHTSHHMWTVGDNIVYTSALREVEVAPFCQTRFKLPHRMWDVIGRAAWYASHRSQPESLQQTKARAEALVDQLQAYGSQQRVLIVSHGMFLLVLQRELWKRGFRRTRVPGRGRHRLKGTQSVAVWRLDVVMPARVQTGREAPARP